jgi:NADH-quinone oxidoreductase subunit L
MDHPIAVSSLRWIVALPLLGAAVNGLAGAALQKHFGKRAVSLIACAPVGLAFLISLSVLFQLLGLPAEERFLLDHCWTWIDIGSLKADIAFWADPLSAVMILVVTGVGGLIHLYSIGYMHEEPAYWRYFAYLNLFTAMMLTLVLGDNVLLLFVGWEGVGLCSYALIGFWYGDWANASAGSKAFIVNRIGDFGFMLGAFLLFWTMADEGHGSVVFREIQQHAHVLEGKTFWGMAVPTLVTLLMFVGATGKSAQIPLYVWLPDAMAGPTPVSALIHAATMVTAGVYMIGRFNFVFTMAPVTLHVVAWVGAITALFAATIGTAQNDIKKVLAYSTVSQLGYMFLGMGVGAYAAGIFHLMTHAFFKACLFLGSGSVIHAMHHEQDMRKMGGLKKWMPLTYWTFLLSTLAISGIPPMSGFFSKDEILWKAFSSDLGSPLLWLMGFAAAGLTAFYMFRQVFMTFHGEFRGAHDAPGHGHGGEHDHPHESPAAMTYPLIFLAGLALLASALGVPASLGGANRFEQWLEPVFAHGHAAPAAHGEGHDMMEYVLMLASVGVALTGILIARAMYLTKTLSPDILVQAFRGKLYRAVYNKYYVDEIYEAVFVNGLLWLTRLSAAFDTYIVDGIVNAAGTLTRLVSWLNGLFDNYVVDGLVNAVALLTMGIGGRFRRLQTGSINGYLYAIVAGVLVVMVVRLAWAG